MSKKKKKSNKKSKRTLKRVDRLNCAKQWILEYTGKNIVRGYSKKFNVDLLCAVKELEILGYPVDPKYKKQLEQSRLDLQRQREKRKLEKEYENDIESDDIFAYIVGYTSGGAPYGVRWDELDSNGEMFENEECNTIETMGDEDCPF